MYQWSQTKSEKEVVFSVCGDEDKIQGGDAKEPLEMALNTRPDLNANANASIVAPKIQMELDSAQYSGANSNALDQFITLEEIISITSLPSNNPSNLPLANQIPISDFDHDLANTNTNSNSDTCSPRLDLINDAWGAFYPNPSTIPPLTKHTMEYLFRCLRTWPSMVARELQLPPIIHARHAEAPLLRPLSKCFTLCKMWYCESATSGEMVQQTIMREMQAIFNQYWSYNEETLLASLQALTIYVLMLLFPSKRAPLSTLAYVDPQIFTAIQTIVYHFVSLSLILPAEQNASMPPYRKWIHVEATRRAVLTLYLIHWAYSIYHCLPSFACEELGFMPASAAKYLWQATNEQEWEKKYEAWLRAWKGVGFLQGEFVAIEEGVTINERAERWLEEADEFGVMFMTIVNAAEREPYFTHAPGRTMG
ncbi:hypothetical protein HYFRA_00012190 [Hymenoscyphus fraxineus]|uniref:Transcription factor domain-containing protein n=1 Tax=Hymenoscyphus fraxineus TaxID=746836 RepID=A0A9N9PX73_9HELO|nr:hypothetical protein HYFRA_00012190 [Hymenoscyphus fraxineus]